MREVNTIKSSDDEINKQFSFVLLFYFEIFDNFNTHFAQKLEVGVRRYYMGATNNNDKELWIGAIGKLLKIEINISSISIEGKQMVKLTQRKLSSDEEDEE